MVLELIKKSVTEKMIELPLTDFDFLLLDFDFVYPLISEVWTVNHWRPKRCELMMFLSYKKNMRLHQHGNSCLQVRAKYLK